jgi:methionine-rich copper-binding protein CopC
MARSAVGFAVFLGFSMFAGVALAHPHLASSSPGDGARVAKVASIRLVFSESIEAKLCTVRVETGEDEKAFVVPSAEADPADSRVLVVVPFEPLPQGRYVVRWTAVGADGHPAKGSLRFLVSK